MANRHFGKLSDVWKHAALVVVLEREAPLRFIPAPRAAGYDRARRCQLLPAVRSGLR